MVTNFSELVEVLLPLPEGGTTVPAIALLSAVFVVGFEQIVQWKFGATGIIGLLLISIGIKAKSPAISSIGAVVLALLFTGPAL